MEASSKCPICGVDTPHTHDAKTAKEYWDVEREIGQRAIDEHQHILKARSKIDAVFLKALQDRIDSAVAHKKIYEELPQCCRIARVGDDFIKSTIGTLNVHKYGWESRSPYLVYCPDCGTCLYDRT